MNKNKMVTISIWLMIKALLSCWYLLKIPYLWVISIIVSAAADIFVMYSDNKFHVTSPAVITLICTHVALIVLVDNIYIKIVYVFCSVVSIIQGITDCINS